MNQTGIEWAEKTWNVVTGCTPISEGCANCYAKRMAQRLRGRCGYPEDEPFRVTLHPDRLEEPLRLRKPSRIFVCSMSDLFHEDVPDEFVGHIFEVMAMRPEHTFIVLTKRPERMRQLLTDEVWQRYAGGYSKQWPLPNVWLGVTAENQDRADERIPVLLQTPANVRFVSCEPLLGPIDFSKVPGFNRMGVSLWHWWIIAGGETGPNARPMHPDWVRGLRDQCQAAGVPFMFKQWGEYFPRDQWEHNPYLVLPDDDVAYHNSPRTHVFDSEEGPCPVHRVGKKGAGRLLDGREWNEYPEAR